MRNVVSRGSSTCAVAIGVAALSLPLLSCSDEAPKPLSGGSGGGSGTGGASAGAAGASAGAGTAMAMGGAGMPSGGSAGAATGGTSGGVAAGGSAPGGAAGASTAGNGGGGSPSGGSNAGGSGGSGADCSTFKLCDGFEGDAPANGASAWTITGGAAVTVVTDQHHSGTHAVHIMAPNTPGFTASITETKTFPAVDFWGRAFLRFKAAAGGHQMYIAVNFPGDQLRLLNRLGSNDNAQVNFQGQGDPFFDTGTKIPMETWFCYEWHVTTSAVNVFFDGKAQTTSKPIQGISGATSLSVGFKRYAAGGGDGEIWIDDVAVNDKQLGCQ